LFKELGYQYAFAPDFTKTDDEDGDYERESASEVVLLGRLKTKLTQINPSVPLDQIDEAIKKLLNLESVKLIENNRTFHKYLTDGVEIPYQEDGEAKTALVKLFDFNDISNNDWLVTNQFTVTEAKENRRPDVVVFVNGLPLAVIELKSPSDEKATMFDAFTQLQNYKSFIPNLFNYNEILIASDGYKAAAGSLTADWERFMPWKTVNGEKEPRGMIELEVLVKGMFQKERFLDIIRNFIVFEVNDDRIIKKMAGYHQYHAVNKALERTVTATSAAGDKRIGVVWHTQGSGKSLSMIFYSGKVVQKPELSNPTLVILTDRNDLDDQLFGNFSLCGDLLRQKPVQAESRAHLRELLNVASGGIVFTTIQKFFPKEGEDSHPELSPRRNIIVMADEAHRSQYDFIDGFARHIRDALPGASFIGFTGTPIETSDKVTTAVFGEYIDIYDMEDAVRDGATVRIYYEARLAKIEFDEKTKPTLDPEFEEVTEDQEEYEKQKLQAKMDSP
ncbi:MAG: type I restriction endonuclease subunit R, partial [Geovibrio sp.]|nr:type I restriction endonuclease subunit R [Geovibrio sp.]